MRTTVTLDDDLFQALERQARKAEKPFKQVLNDAIRAGLKADRQSLKPGPRYRAKVVDCTLRPGIDPLRLNQLADELETGDALAGSGRRA